MKSEANLAKTLQLT